MCYQMPAVGHRFLGKYKSHGNVCNPLFIIPSFSFTLFIGSLVTQYPCAHRISLMPYFLILFSKVQHSSGPWQLQYLKGRN